MSGSERFSWCFEFGICNQFNHLRLGCKLLILGSLGIGVILEFFPCENFRDSMSKGVKQCHKLVGGCSMRVILIHLSLRV
jgi:hypothetical protein